MDLPSDGYILLSVVNTKLRDEYASFEELCREEEVDPHKVTERLSELGYVYAPENKAFMPEK